MLQSVGSQRARHDRATEQQPRSCENRLWVVLGGAKCEAG